MSLTGRHTYVGFGFGAIQAGLFLYEAFQSGRFRRLVVAEVVPEVVDELRKAGGFYSLNIAHADRIETAQVGPVEVFDPASDEDRERLVSALAESQEIGTAVPSIRHYATGGPDSLHRLLAAGLTRKAGHGAPRAVVYAAENDNRAAEILEELVLHETPKDRPVRRSHGEGGRDDVSANVRFLNTVIGKMSGLPADPARNRLATVTPASRRAFLVEAFNRILISKITFPDRFERGIAVFQEKDDLLQFEEAKLYGHNATHALAAYLGMMLQVRKIGDLRPVPGFMSFLRDAFIQESGAALIRRHRDVDPLFTEAGYTRYADDLLERMTNPFLMDTVERVGRDAERKLGWSDRLIGTVRLALSQGIEPRRYAIGAAAALTALDKGFLEGRVPARRLAVSLWGPERPNDADRETVLAHIDQGRRVLLAWRKTGFGDLREVLDRTP